MVPRMACFSLLPPSFSPGSSAHGKPDRPWHHRSCQCARIYFAWTPIDEQGILPDAFETACKAGDVRALVMIPTLGNPTSHLMGAGRRIAIAEIARRYDVCVIEDEVYKPILEEKLPSMPELLPDLGFFVTSFTKTVMTGLRTGYLVVPTQYSIRVTSILRVTSWSGVNLMGEMASRWIEDGTAGN